jgi:glycosyltransferase involved in cell wall biosynthesis
MKRKVLFIGNLPGNDPRSVGGANTYTNEILLKLKESNEFDLDFFSVRSRWYKGGQFIDYPLFLIKFLLKVYKFDVISIHATWDFHLTIGPLIALISKFLNKKLIYHFFGGRFHNMFESYPLVLRKWLSITIFRADYKLVETKKMISAFGLLGFNNFIWFPNARPKNLYKNVVKTYNYKFLFISRVTPTKGIDTIIETSKMLDEKYSIDIYGPINHKYYNEKSFNEKNINYKGVLKPHEVNDVINNNDVLLLPTFHPGEGYPGIVIEALSLGMPIITTHWNSLNEIVKNGFNGRLISVKSSEELKNSMEFFTESNFLEYSENALKSFNPFDLDFVIDKLKKLYYA